MASVVRNLSLAVLCASLAHGATDAAVSGVVKDPGGAVFKGAFVRARNVKTKVTTSVLSDREGSYHVQNLPPGDYDIRATATGYKDDLHGGVILSAGKPLAMDFNLGKGMVRWSDLSVYQGKKLMPPGKGKEVLERECYACHGFETRIAAMPRDEAGWLRAVNYMTDAMHYRLFLDDPDRSALVSYLNANFGLHPALPASPSALPDYQETVRPFSDEAMKIVYVDYELPGPNRHPFSAAPDKDGNIWIPYFGRANQIGRLDPNTGEVQEFPVPNRGTAAIHSAVAAPDGTVWLAEHGSNKLGKWDPATRTITEYQDAYLPGLEGNIKGGNKHTLRIDPTGKVWVTGSPLVAFDPKTREFMRFKEVPQVYGVVIDKEGNPWFAEWTRFGKIGKVDAKTLKVTKWNPPTAEGRPRRIQIDPDGYVWFTEWNASKIARFDPKTETFKEWALPGPDPTPYALGLDRQNRVWYSSEDMDIVGCLDPKTGKIVEYPFPYSENSMREFFSDAQGRMWFATPANNKVGYFTLSE